MPESQFETDALDWDYAKIFELSGGTAKLRRLIANEGYIPPPPETFYMWKNRNKIASAWVPTIIYVLLKAGAKFHELLRVRAAPLLVQTANDNTTQKARA